jgi:predicted unusual protein kinase regulating ubiquinone biosynthesis (AarF/ABC1/UbiB family)
MIFKCLILFYFLKFLIKLSAKIFPSFTFVWLAEEIEKNLPIELNFTNEAKNIERIKAIYANHKFIKVYKIHFNLIKELNFIQYLVRILPTTTP